MNDPVLMVLGPRRVLEGKWYPDSFAPGYKLGQVVSLQVQMQLSGNGQMQSLRNVAPEHVRVLSKKTLSGGIDMTQQVSIFGLTVTAGKNYTSAKTALFGSGYLSRTVEQMQNEMDNLQTVFRLPKGTFEMFAPLQDGALEKPISVIHAQDSVLFLNPAAIRSAMWVTPENIGNGIVPLDDVQDPRLPTWRPSEACPEPPKGAICKWYALPPHHVLATYLYRHETWTQQPGDPHPVVFRLNGQVVTIAVCDQELEQLKWQFLASWASMMDRRCLGDVAFGASTLLDSVPAQVEMTVNISYVQWPYPIDGSAVAPEISPKVEQLIKN